MALTYGFYDSINGDRTYNAEQFSRFFDGIITDGILKSVGSCFKVVPGNGMTVKVGSGRAWFNNTWTYNDSDFQVTLPSAHATLTRIDSIILRIDEQNRTNSITYKSGTPASSPTAPTLTNNETTHEYRIANISVRPTVVSIVANDITQIVGTTTTPYATLSDMNVDFNTIANKPNLITGTGTRTNNYIAKFSGTNTVTNGPAFGSDTTKFLRNDGSWASPAGGVTGVKGNAETSYRTGQVNITPANIGAQAALTNPITGTGTRTTNYLAKFSGTNTVTNGPAFGSDTTKFLRNDGSWASPNGGVTGVKGNSENSYRTGQVNLTAANVGALPLSGGTMTGTISYDYTNGVFTNKYPLSVKFKDPSDNRTYTNNLGITLVDVGGYNAPCLDFEDVGIFLNTMALSAGSQLNVISNEINMTTAGVVTRGTYTANGNNNRYIYTGIHPFALMIFSDGFRLFSSNARTNGMYFIFEGNSWVPYTIGSTDQNSLPSLAQSGLNNTILNNNAFCFTLSNTGTYNWANNSGTTYSWIAFGA